MSDLPRVALEFFEKLDRLSTKADVFEELCEFAAQFGASHACINFIPRPRQGLMEALVMESLPPGFLIAYQENHFVNVDPTYEAATNAVTPFLWADVEIPKHKHGREFVACVTDYKIQRGLVIPMPTVSGPLGMAWFGGEHMELEQPVQALAHIVALYGFEKLNQFRPARARSAVQLSARELEILHWIARGKSAWDIGEILKIGNRTVETYAESAVAKLGAGNRAHAVALAVRDKLIRI